MPVSIARRAPRVVFASLSAPVGLMGALWAGCTEGREPATTPTYDQSVSAILASRCTACHATGDGWKATSYFATLACVRSGAAATLPADEASPLARAISDATHAGVLGPGERDVLVRWIRAGAPKSAGGVHGPSFVDPRSPQSHGRALRAERWRSMLDATSEGACGRCHEGAPSGRPPKVTESAPGATPCTTCHSEPKGALACGTCHGDATRASPPRDPCFFPEEAARAGAHAAHVAPGPLHAQPLACESCHTVPGERVIDGAHGNGVVDVVLDPSRSGPSASYDATSRSCTTSCHARAGAAKPKPTWTEAGPLTCDACHGAPPPAHPTGACRGCHAEADAIGTALAAASLHADGKVDLGDGSGKCGACHGAGDDPWPKDGAHATHRAPGAAAAVACATCHQVPVAFGPGKAHPRGGAAKVVMTGTAALRGAAPSWSGQTCSDVYCHGAKLIGTAAKSPAWNDTSGKDKQCVGCHDLPPASPHVGVTACALCHGSVVDPSPAGPPGVVFTRPAQHVDGLVNR